MTDRKKYNSLVKQKCANIYLMSVLMKAKKSDYCEPRPIVLLDIQVGENEVGTEK